MQRIIPHWFCFVFQHEEASVAMFDYMVELEINHLKPVFEKYGFTEEDRTFIKEQIVGKPLTKSAQGDQVMNESVKI